MTNKPVRHESLGWDRACAMAFIVLAAFNFVAAVHYAGAKSLAFNLIGTFAAVSAIYLGRSLVKATSLVDALLPAAPMRAIDRLHAEIGQRMAQGEKFEFVYNEQSFRRA